ncbi:Uncharacterised protein [Bordetella pertussis]|nr:Uncharacterised protein [Bordetella pertussis]
MTARKRLKWLSDCGDTLSRTDSRLSSCTMLPSRART